MIVIPRVLRGGTTVNAGVNLFGKKSCDVELKLYDRSHSVVSRASARFEPNEEGILKIDVSKLFRLATGSHLSDESEIFRFSPSMYVNECRSN